MTLAEKDRAKREIALGHGCAEEREKRRAKRKRQGRSVVFVMGWLLSMLCCVVRRITNFVFGLLSLFTVD
jgi:hypothetical protein